MRVFLVIKGRFSPEALRELIARRIGAVDIHSVDESTAFETRCEVRIDDTLPVYHWFNEGGQHRAPFPIETLLWFRDLDRT